MRRPRFVLPNLGFFFTRSRSKSLQSVRMAKSSFKYTKLKSELQEVRILSIMNGCQSVEIECTLEHIHLVGGSNYKALSYTWGNPSDTSYIKLNNQPFLVTASLAIALQHLRKETEVVELWVDAICINQQDTDEKSVQVRRMKEIYEKAKEIIVWLGPESDDSRYAMNAINSIDRRWAKRTSQPVMERFLAAPKLDKRALWAINQLLCRPWWRRVWIIQEATCDSATYIKCGNDQIEFIAVVATVNFITQHTLERALRKDFNSPDITPFHRVIALDKLKLNRSRSEYCMNFLSLLEDSRMCDASDPRDKVFALSGLATDAQREAGNPDYSISVDVAYSGFTNTLIISEQNLNILGHCQAAVRDPKSWSSFKLLPSTLLPKQPLPSWTPDWTMNLEATPFMKYEIPNDICSNKVYKTSGDYPPSVQLSECLRTLFVRGCTFDVISKLGEDFTRLFRPLTARLWHSWAEQELGSTYITKETTHEAFLHTLTADIRPKNGRCVRGSTALWPIPKTSEKEDSFVSNSMIKQAFNSRGFFISAQGYMGVARFDVIKGDQICILHGGQTPFILRQEGQYHLFKGECYLHGIMDGEGMRYPRVWQDFALH